MKKEIPETPLVSTPPTWETLEDFARLKIQEFVQSLVVEEVTVFFGCERRVAVDAAAGYRNGFGKPRKLSMQTGTITVRRPRVRGLEARFESRLLPLCAGGTRSRP